jgi:D-proline reductase (dithiol) PrdB
MVRLADLPEWEREHMLDKLKGLAGFDARPWTQPPRLRNCRIAIVTTAGLHRKGDRPFGPSALATDYRVIAGATPAAELTMSHQSVNSTAPASRKITIVVFPLDRLHELAASTSSVRRRLSLFVHGRGADQEARAESARARAIVEAGSRRSRCC